MLYCTDFVAGAELALLGNEKEKRSQFSSCCSRFKCLSQSQFVKSLCNPKPLGIHFEKTECMSTVHVIEQRGQASADWYISPEQS